MMSELEQARRERRFVRRWNAVFVLVWIVAVVVSACLVVDDESEAIVLVVLLASFLSLLLMLARLLSGPAMIERYEPRGFEPIIDARLHVPKKLNDDSNPET